MIAPLSKVIHSNGYFLDVNYTLKLVKLYSSINTPFLNESRAQLYFTMNIHLGQFCTPMIAALSKVIHSNGYFLEASYTLKLFNKYSLESSYIPLRFYTFSEVIIPLSSIII